MKVWFLPIVIVVILKGCSVDYIKTSSSETLIEYRRSGGFANLDDLLIIKKSGEAELTRKSERSEFTLDSDTIRHLRTLFEEANFLQLRKEYLPSRSGADRFEYIVTYQGHTVRTMDGAVPPSLEPILEALNQIVQNQGK